MAKQQISTNTFGIAKWVVSANAWEGTHTTIQAAVTAASSGEVVFIRHGTYTENITLKAGVNLCGQEGSEPNATVNIVGRLTASTDGIVAIKNVTLTTNSDYILVLGAANTDKITFDNCYFVANGNTAISYTSSDVTSYVTLRNCVADIPALTTAFFINTSAGTFSCYGCTMTNSGASTTNSTSSAGLTEFFDSVVKFAITTSGSSYFTGTRSTFDTATQNIEALTIGGGQGSLFLSCEITTGTASAISSASSVVISKGSITSANTNAIAGAGIASLYRPTFIMSNGLASTLTIAGADVNILAVGNGSAIVNACYTIKNATPANLTTITLPTTATFGDYIEIVGYTSGGWKVEQNAGQLIYMGVLTTTTGVTGSLASTHQKDCVRIRCVTAGASTEWIVESSIGNITVV